MYRMGFRLTCPSSPDRRTCPTPSFLSLLQRFMRFRMSWGLLGDTSALHSAHRSVARFHPTPGRCGCCRPRGSCRPLSICGCCHPLSICGSCHPLAVVAVRFPFPRLLPSACGCCRPRGCCRPLSFQRIMVELLLRWRHSGVPKSTPFRRSRRWSSCY